MLFAWEEEDVGELTHLLQSVTLQILREDRWNWSLEPTNIYFVCSVYNFLNDKVSVNDVAPVPSLWHKDVPLKVVLFAWRLFRDRLPTRDNLYRRNVLASDAQICAGGCELSETTSHLFLH